MRALFAGCNDDLVVCQYRKALRRFRSIIPRPNRLRPGQLGTRKFTAFHDDSKKKYILITNGKYNGIIAILNVSIE